MKNFLFRTKFGAVLLAGACRQRLFNPPRHEARQVPGRPRPGGSLRACLHAVVVGLCCALFAPELIAAPYAWVLEPMTLPAGRSGSDPELLLETADGQVVATSRECQILEQAGERLICGRLPVDRNGIFVLKLRLRETSGETLTLTLDRAFDVDAGPAYDVLLILDASLSMRKSDPRNLRAEAVRQFCLLARNSLRIRTLSLIVFRDTADVRLPPTPPLEIADLAPYLKHLTPSGRTDFNGPFRQAADLFAKSAGRKRAILFLSDGKPVYKYKDTHRLLDRENCPVYTLGLSPAADAALLSRIAADTGGHYFPVQTADQLRPLFTRVFQVLGRSETIVKRLVMVEPAASIPFWVDETMRNVILTAAPASGSVRAWLDTPPAAGAEIIRDLSVTPVLELNLGRHEYQFSGSGRVSCEITAETGIALQAVALTERGPPGQPLQFACFLRGGELVQDLRLTGTARDPSDQPVPVTVSQTAFGLYTMTAASTLKPGRYTVSIEAAGHLPSGEIHRETSLTFLRLGERVPEAAAAAAVTLAPVVARPLGDDSSPLPVTVDHRVAPENGLTTTFWASRDTLALPLLPPGHEAKMTVDVLLNSAVGSAVSFNLDPPVADELVCRCDGTIVSNQKSPLVLTARASSRSAGQQYTGALVVQTGGKAWRLPVSIQVDTPVINANPDPVELRLDGGMLEARQTFTLTMTPAGNCDLSITCHDPQLVITPGTVNVGPLPVKISLQFRTPPPPTRQLFQREVRVTGPGLTPVTLPFAVELKPVKAPLPAAAEAGTGFRLSWPILLAVLILLLILLLAAILRGNRRAVYVLISLVIHILVLFLVLPDMQDKPQTGGAAASLAPGDGGATIEEERIALESGAATQLPAAPEAAVADKAAAALAPTATDTAKPLTPEAAPQTEARTEASNPVAPATREALTPQAMAAEAVREAARKREETASTTTERQETAATKVDAAPQATVTESAAAAVATATPAPVTADALTQAVENRTAIERSAMAPQLLSASAMAPQGKKQKTSASTTATDRPAAAQGTANAAPVGTMMVRLDTVVEAHDLSVMTAGSGTGAEIVATPRQTGTDLPRPELQLTDMESPAAGIGVQKENHPAGGKSSVQRRQQSESHANAEARAAVGAAPAAAVITLETAGTGSASRSLPVATVAGAGLDLPVTVTASAVAPAALPNTSSRLADVPAGAPSLPLRPRQATAASSPGEAAEALAIIPSPLGRSGAGAPSETPGAGKTIAITEVTGSTIIAPAHALTTPANAETRQTHVPTGGSGLPDLSSPGKAPEKGRPSTVSGLDTDIQVTALTSLTARVPSSLSPATPAATATALLPVPEITLRSTAGLKDGGHMPQLPGATDALAASAGRWRNTFPNLQYRGDWDCDKTAMLNLAHQFAKRTGSTLPFDSRTVNPRQGDLPQAPFLFMSGHTDFTFSPEEIRRLRDYVRTGGFLWINDSTDVGDEVYDRAVRRELARLFPDQRWEKIPMDHALFQGPYDLTRGFKGYKVPPGDKYRLEYLEGLKLKERMAVIYTRNDYGDGLEIDVHTHPLMASLTDLSPADMQESSIQMGINIALYCLNYGRATAARESATTLKSADTEATLRAELKNCPRTPVALFAPLAAWSPPTDWGGQLLSTQARPVTRPDSKMPDALAVEFATPAGQQFKGWSSQAVLGRDCTLPLSRQHVLMLDLNSQLTGGARLALAFKSNEMYAESAPVFFRPGPNRDLIIDLRQKTFKTAASQWQYTVAFPEDLQVAQVYLIIMPQQAGGRVELANLRLLKP